MAFEVRSRNTVLSSLKQAINTIAAGLANVSVLQNVHSAPGVRNAEQRGSGIGKNCPLQRRQGYQRPLESLELVARWREMRSLG